MTQSVAPESVPADYTELVEGYFDYVRAICRKMGVREDQDAAQTILLKFYERKFLSVYDPEYRSEYDGVIRRPKFSTFLGTFVARYCLHLRERESTQLKRESLVGVSVGAAETIWIEEADLSTFEEAQIEEQVIAAINARLEALPVRGRRDLKAMFAEIVVQARDSGKIDRKALGKKLGLGSTTIGSMIQELRGEVRAALA